MKVRTAVVIGVLLCTSAAGRAQDVEGPANNLETPDPDTPDIPETEQPQPKWFALEPAALNGPLVTDRPDFTESPETIARGHIQFEMGYLFVYDREDDERVREHTAPQFLARLGLVENLELRIGWAGYSWTDKTFKGETHRGFSVTREDWTDGAHDLALGFKLKLVEQEGWLPNFAVLGTITLPTGSSVTSSGDVEPTVGLAWAYGLSERWSVAGNVNFSSLVDDTRRFFQTSASLSLALALTDHLGTYFEYFGFYPNAKETDAAHSLNGGFTYLITDNFQIDISAGFGLNEEADDFFTGIGFAWRF